MMRFVQTLVCFMGLLVCHMEVRSAESAAQPSRTEIRLWPNGSPGNEEKLPPEKDITKDSDNLVGGKRLIRLANVSDPTIMLYPAPAGKATGAAVLVCPGGAYNILAMDLEGTEVCERLNQTGVTAILLKYRVPMRKNQERYVAALQDAQRAMGIIRQHAGSWALDDKRIGVMGFSAGGHLAAVLSNHSDERTYPKVDAADELSSRPNFSILIYPAYLTPEKDGSKLAPELSVSTNTAQAFIVMTGDDSVRVENALTYSTALKAAKVPFELHVFPTGGHGYGLRKTKESVTAWPDRLEEWFVSRALSR